MGTLGGRASEPPPGLNEQHWGWDWRRQAACLEEDSELFYPEMDVSEQVQKAKAVCRRCIVREECLAVALISKDQHGIWGGLTPQERRAIERHRCLWCKKPLLMWRPDRKYCGPTCANRYASKQRASLRLVDNSARQCVWCGGVIPPTRRSDSVTCSRDCNTKLQNKRGWERRRQRHQAVSA
jgi:WhiB family redox-sensing transcriptional regulator